MTERTLSDALVINLGNRVEKTDLHPCLQLRIIHFGLIRQLAWTQGYTHTHNERWVWTCCLPLAEVKSYSDSRMSCSCGNNFNCSNVSDRRSCVNYEESESEQPLDFLAGRTSAYITFGIGGEEFVLAEHTAVAGQVVEENLDERPKRWSTDTYPRLPEAYHEFESVASVYHHRQADGF